MTIKDAQHKHDRDVEAYNAEINSLNQDIDDRNSQVKETAVDFIGSTGKPVYDKVFEDHYPLLDTKVVTKVEIIDDHETQIHYCDGSIEYKFSMLSHIEMDAYQDAWDGLLTDISDMAYDIHWAYQSVIENIKWSEKMHAHARGNLFMLKRDIDKVEASGIPVPFLYITGRPVPDHYYDPAMHERVDNMLYSPS